MKVVVLYVWASEVRYNEECADVYIYVVWCLCVYVYLYIYI